MKLIVGLGNYGETYEKTRHNTAWHLFDTLDLTWHEQKKFQSFIAESRQYNQKILYIKPTTYYNDSGLAVHKIKEFYRVSGRDILIVHDELALPFGSVRTRYGGSDAGNNGVKSINVCIGTDTARLRIGIDSEIRAKRDDADFVLSRFSVREQKELPRIFATAQSLIEAFIQNDFPETTHTHSV